jgi:hypothetical protein
MKLVLGLLLMTGLASADDKRPAWQGRPLVVRGKLASVHVAPTLYTRSDAPRGFLIAVWIRNTSDKPIAIDGTGERWFVHPNQWTISDEPRRLEVNERTLMPQKLDAARKAELVRRMNAKTITMLAPGASLESYVAFDGVSSSRADIDRAKGRYYILALDGEVLVTDGTTFESLGAKTDGQTESDLVLATPVPWRELPPLDRK